MNAPPSDSKSASNDESSVLFSLTELMDLESERVAEEEEAQRRARKRAEREREESGASHAASGGTRLVHDRAAFHAAPPRRAPAVECAST